jgi:hypothetical protein
LYVVGGGVSLKEEDDDEEEEEAEAEAEASARGGEVIPPPPFTGEGEKGG